MKLGIRIILTQVEDEMIHGLFEVYNIIEFNEKQYPNKFKELLTKLKESAIKLSKGES